MNYDIVYDVMDDSVFAGREYGLYFSGFAVFWTFGWWAFHKFVRGVPEVRRKNLAGGLVVGGVLVAVGGLVLINETIPVIRDQRKCRAWLLSREHETVEGTIVSFKREAGSFTAPSHFQVGETKFEVRIRPPRAGGFRGSFTAPGTEGLRLKDGLNVRIACRDGRILRVEVAR
jgi:hypothetical protein